MGKPPRAAAHCSFCGKAPDRVRKLVAGPGVFICSECVSLCSEVLAEDRRSGPPTARASKTYRGGGRHGFRAWLRGLFFAGRGGYPASSSSSTSLS